MLGKKRVIQRPIIEGNLNNMGSLGANGVTAQITQDTYQSIEVVVINNAEKDFSVIVTLEEGRQINHEQINYTLQVDSYGRPIIGFSHEPYDFAAIKFMSITSQVRFQQNMERTRESFAEYFIGQNGETAIEKAAHPAKLAESQFQTTGGQGKGITLPQSTFKTENTNFNPTELPTKSIYQRFVFREQEEGR